VLALPATAAEPPTIVANVEILGRSTPLILSGTIPSGAQGESVIVEAKDCGASFYRVFGGATSASGGAWSYRGWMRVNTSFRARWRGAVSEPTLVRLRLWPFIERRAGTRIFVASVFSSTRMDGGIVRLERFTAGGWVLVRTAKLRSERFGIAEARFRIRTRGLQLRVVLPEASAKPCYAAGASEIFRS
jgi:hypothetical protein